MAGDTPVAAAICLPVQRCRRSRSTSSTTAWGVGRRNRWGRDDRSCRPANPSPRYRSTHFRTVRGQTPTASATASGVCPLATCRTIRSRPRGVSRAFLWMFIRSSRELLKPRNSSFLGLDRVDNLRKLTARAVTTTAPGSASACARAAMFGTSPKISPDASTTTGPVLLLFLWLPDGLSRTSTLPTAGDGMNVRDRTQLPAELEWRSEARPAGDPAQSPDRRGSA